MQAPGGASPGGASGARRLRPLAFTGSSAEYFRIWVAGLLLSVASLGIYSAWARVQQRRYLCRNTWFAGSAFDYHARPAALLTWRALFAILLVGAFVTAQLAPRFALGLLVAGVLVLPWLLQRACRFHWASMSWRGVRFGFLGSVRQAYGALAPPVLGWALAMSGIGLLAWWRDPALLPVVLPPAALLAALALVPLLHHRITQYRLDHACLGLVPAHFSAPTSAFYGCYLRTLGLALLLAAGIVLLALAALVAALGVERLAELVDEVPRGMPAVAGLGLAGLAVTVFAWLLLVPRLEASLRRLVWGRTRLGPFRFVSRLRARELWAVRASNLVLIATTFGLFLPCAAIRLARCRVCAVEVAVLGNPERIMAEAGASPDSYPDALARGAAVRA